MIEALFKESPLGSVGSALRAEVASRNVIDCFSYDLETDISVLKERVLRVELKTPATGVETLAEGRRFFVVDAELLKEGEASPEPDQVPFLTAMKTKKPRRLCNCQRGC